MLPTIAQTRRFICGRRENWPRTGSRGAGASIVSLSGFFNFAFSSSARFARRIFFRPGWEPIYRLQVKIYFQKHYNIAILSGNCDASPLIDSDVFEAYVERISVCHVFGSRTQTENFQSTHIIKDGALELHVRKAAGRFLSHCFSFLISKVTIKIFASHVRLPKTL